MTGKDSNSNNGDSGSENDDSEKTVIRPEKSKNNESKLPPASQVPEEAEEEKTVLKPRKIVRPDATGHNSTSNLSQKPEETSEQTVLRPRKVIRSDATGQSSKSNATSSTTGSAWAKAVKAETEEISVGVGTVLKERFKLVEILGHGGMGTVYKAEDERDIEANQRKTFLAIKVLNDEFRNDTDLLRALHGEARKTQQLAHPNIVNVFDFDRDGSVVYMTMEYMTGLPLDDFIKSQPNGISTDSAINMVNQMASALTYAHSNHIIHSDFKPGNIYIGENQKIKVLDFGIARVAKSEQLSTDFDAGVLGGLTPAYASLEMFNEEDPDPSDDLYALACVAYELLTGRHPFNKRGSIKAMNEGLEPKKIPTLNPKQWKALKKGLAFERKHRYAEIQDFVDGLNAKKSKLPIIAGVTGVGLILAAILAKDPLQEYWKQIESEDEIDELESEINKGDIENMLKALAMVEVLSESNSFRIETEDRISEKILEHIKIDGYDFVSKFIVHLDDLSDKLRQEVLFKGKDGLLSFYEKEMDVILSSSQNTSIFQSVEGLLNDAEGYFPDSFKLQRLQDKKNDLILKIDNRFSESLKQKKMLSDPDRDDMVDVLTELIRINPNHPLASDARAEGAYVREATAALENDQEKLAKQLVDQGKVFFTSSSSLADLSDQVDALVQFKDKQNAIIAMEKQINNLIESISVDFYSWVQQVRSLFTQLITLNPENKLIDVVKTRTGDLLDKEIKVLTDQRKWEEALALTVDVRTMITDKAYADSEQKISQIKAAFELKRKSLEAKIKELAALPQTNNTIAQINQVFSDLNKLTSDHPLIQIAREQVSLSFMQIAEDMRSEAKWDKAFEYLDFASKVNSEEQFLQSVADKRTEMKQAKLTLASMEKEEQALAQQREQELRKNRRQQKVTAEIERFNAMIGTMAVTEESAFEAKLILDSIAALDEKNPILERGYLQIENVFAKEVYQLISQQKWKNAETILKRGLVAFPESSQLKEARIEIDNGLVAQLKKKQQLQLEQHKKTLEQLVQQPSLDKAWQKKVASELAGLSKLVDKNDNWIKTQKAKIISVLLDQSKQLVTDKRISGARDILSFGLKIDSSSSNITNALNTLDKEQALLKEKSRQIELKAERDGLKQSFEIQLKANKLNQALASFKKLKKIEGVDKNYTKRVATKLIADAYYRLANIQLDKKNDDVAKALIKKGLGYNKTHDKLNRLRLKLKAIDEKEKQEEERKKAAYKKLIDSRTPDIASKGPDQKETVVSKNAKKEAVEQAAKTVKPKEVVIKSVPKSANAKACSSKFARYGRRSKARCYDIVSGTIKGPILAVIPAGGGNSSSYAIGINEVSVKEYNHYCKFSGKCTSHRVSNNPITGISLNQAKGYAQWLSKVSGFDYRLPNKQQWVYAAKAGGKKGVKDFNCKLVSGGSVIKGKTLVSAKSGKKNAWGLRNYIGNAQEWVMNGGQVLVMGGAHTDAMTICDINLQKSHSGSADKITGFRVVRKL